MSDFYIKRLDDIHTVQGVRNLHDAMVLDYTEKMCKICHSDTNSKHISVCKEYIYSHIKEKSDNGTAILDFIQQLQDCRVLIETEEVY